jgi:hypothetical protein
MNLCVTAPDRVTVDGRQGTITFDRATDTGKLLVDDIVVNYRLYGPFGQGYNFGIVAHGMERLKLSYSVRAGLPEIYQPDNPQHGLFLDDPIITDYVVTYGSFSYTSASVSVAIGRSMPAVEPLHLSLLVALDAMYAHRLIIFALNPTKRPTSSAGMNEG